MIARGAARTGRSHGTPATSTALVLTIAALAVAVGHGMASGDWSPLGVASVTSWVVFLSALAHDVARLGRSEQ